MSIVFLIAECEIWLSALIIFDEEFTVLVDRYSNSIQSKRISDAVIAKDER